jgi:hypothetical protein
LSGAKVRKNERRAKFLGGSFLIIWFAGFAKADIEGSKSRFSCLQKPTLRPSKADFHGFKTALCRRQGPAAGLVKYPKNRSAITDYRRISSKFACS